MSLRESAGAGKTATETPVFPCKKIRAGIRRVDFRGAVILGQFAPVLTLLCQAFIVCINPGKGISELLILGWDFSLYRYPLRQRRLVPSTNMHVIDDAGLRVVQRVGDNEIVHTLQVCGRQIKILRSTEFAIIHYLRGSPNAPSRFAIPEGEQDVRTLGDINSGHGILQITVCPGCLRIR